MSISYDWLILQVLLLAVELLNVASESFIHSDNQTHLLRTTADLVCCHCLYLVRAMTRTRADPRRWPPGCCWRGLCRRSPRCSPGAAAAPARQPWARARPWRWSPAPRWESPAAALPPRGPRWSTGWCPAGRAARSSGTRRPWNPGSLWRRQWSRTDSTLCGTAASCRSATASPSRSHLEGTAWEQQTAEGARGHFLVWLLCECKKTEFVEVSPAKLHVLQ